MAARQRLYIIDTMAMAFRSFYALGRSALSTRHGVPTGAIYGSAMFLGKLLTEEKPDYLVAVTDAGGKTFRHERYKEYKATRGAMPDDLARQLPYIFELLGHIKCPLIRTPGVEADDVIGTLARRYEAEVDVYIVSGDKDFMQLVDDHVRMYAPKKDQDAQIIDPEGVRAKLGCAPEQVVDVLALTGDSADNVPGVKGIGEKGASKLIATFGSLDGIYAHLDQIKSDKQREILAAGRADAYLSHELITLKTDLPLSTSLADYACDLAVQLANPELLAFYESFEFKTLATRARAALGGGKVLQVETQKDAVQAAAPFTEVTSVVDQDALRAAVHASSVIGFAVQASSSDIISGRATAVALATDDGNRFLVHLSEEGIWLTQSLLMDPGRTIVMHGFKTALEMLRNAGLVIESPVVDLEICDYLLEPNNYDHSLAAAATRYLPGQVATPAPLALPDAASLAHALYKPVLARLDATQLTPVLHEIEMPLVPVLAAMEQRGVYVDAEALMEYSNELAQMAARIETEIQTVTGGPLNLNSPKQLQELLFDQLKLQDKAGIRLKKTKTGFSTDESVLSKLADVHPIPRLLLEYRTVTKLKNTYVDPLPQYIHPQTGRVHARFNQTVAATGRLSSDGPNLQNIPMRSELGRRIRKAFTLQELGTLLISADYSQIELRLLAHLAAEPALTKAFAEGEDVHRITAAKVFGVEPAAVTPLMRSRAKAVNFGIIYGMGPRRLAAETGVTLGEARDFIDRYFTVYPGIRHYTESLIAAARTHGYGVTIKGRRRAVPEVNDSSRVIASHGENIAVNAPLQGSAADLIKLAMIRVDAALRRRRMKTAMLLQVHDELVFCAPERELDDAVAIIRDSMEHALDLSVPLVVDIRHGKDWLEAH